MMSSVCCNDVRHLNDVKLTGLPGCVFYIYHNSNQMNIVFCIIIVTSNQVSAQTNFQNYQELVTFLNTLCAIDKITRVLRV